MNQPQKPALLLPQGTRIVLREDAPSCNQTGTVPKGSVGTVLDSPSNEGNAYCVRFVSGAEALVRREHFSIYRYFHNEQLIRFTDAKEAFDYYSDTVIYRCVVGSTAFGLSQAGSDLDRRGIFLPSAEDHWSLYAVPEQIESPATEETYWETEKFLRLALKANPNILECLYTPIIEYKTELIDELFELRPIFLSKILYQTYNSYVLSQFKRLEMDLRQHGKIRWKHAMHLIRLLLSGITLLKERVVMVDVGNYRSRLLAIRNEEISWEEVNAWRMELHKKFDEAYAHSSLPDCPNYEKANQFLIQARKSRVS